jgi:hypothetical protein
MAGIRLLEKEANILENGKIYLRKKCLVARVLIENIYHL